MVDEANRKLRNRGEEVWHSRRQAPLIEGWKTAVDRRRAAVVAVKAAAQREDVNARKATAEARGSAADSSSRCSIELKAAAGFQEAT